MLSVRPATPADAGQIEAICMAAFNASIVPSLGADGVATFTAVAAARAFVQRMLGDNLVLVCEDPDALLGVAELKQGRHVAMLFVAPQAQRRGVGQTLMTALLAAAREPVVTVSASLPSVAAYERYGFTCSGDVAQSHGLMYQPMQWRRHSHIEHSAA